MNVVNDLLSGVSGSVSFLQLNKICGSSIKEVVLLGVAKGLKKEAVSQLNFTVIRGEQRKKKFLKRQQI